MLGQIRAILDSNGHVRFIRNGFTQRLAARRGD